MPREHHPRGKTFLAREYTKNSETRQIKPDHGLIDMIRAHAEDNGISPLDLIFPAALAVPPRATKLIWERPRR